MREGERGTWNRDSKSCAIIYMYVPTYLWLILYRSYDAPTGYLTCLSIPPSHPPSLP